MMDEANWWRLVGMGRPDKLPARLSDISSQMDGSSFNDVRERIGRFELWHRLAGRAMRPFARSSLATLYYLCRAVSSLFLFGAFLYIWKTFEILAAAFGRTICWGFALVLVLPQFLSIATAATPDAFVILICAAFFNGVAALIAGGSGTGDKERRRVRFGLARIGQAVLVVFLPVIALITDRSAFVIAPLALLSAFLIVRRENARFAIPGILIGAIAVILAARFVGMRYPLTVEQIIRGVTYVFKGIGKAISNLFDFSKFSREFWAFIVDGFLLKFGWLVFGAPAWVYWAWRILLGAAVFGLILRPVKWVKARMNPTTVTNEKELPEGAAHFRPRWLVLTFAAIGIQALATWVFLGGNDGHLGESRYFFPVVVPIVFLLALGLFEFGEFLKKGVGQKILAGTVLAEVLLLTFAIWTRMAPVFHLTLRGPHPGV